MTIWEKVIVNLEKGSKRIPTMAALFAERVRAEIAIARLRIRRDEVQSLISEQYQIIGRKIVDLSKKDELPRSTDQLMTRKRSLPPLAEIAARERDLEDFPSEIANEQAVFKTGEAARRRRRYDRSFRSSSSSAF